MPAQIGGMRRSLLAASCPLCTAPAFPASVAQARGPITTTEWYEVGSVSSEMRPGGHVRQRFDARIEGEPLKNELCRPSGPRVAYPSSTRETRAPFSATGSLPCL